MKILVDEMPQFNFLCPFCTEMEGPCEEDSYWKCQIYPYDCDYEDGKSECNGLKMLHPKVPKTEEALSYGSVLTKDDLLDLPPVDLLPLLKEGSNEKGW